MKSLKKITSKTEDINTIQDNVEEVLNPILTKSVIDGILLKDVAMTTGKVNNLSHKLGRRPLGYIIVKKNANSDIYEQTIDTKTLNLNCTADVTVSIWVF